MKNKLVFLIFVAALLLSACSPAATPAPTPVATIPEIKIEAADFSYNASQNISAGWLRVTLTNSGQEPHHVQFLRLNDGITVEKFQDALKQAEGPALAMTKQMGGVGTINPGGTASAILNLPAGQYVILCLVPSPSDHVAHHVKGMIKALTVAAANGATAPEPTASMSVHLKDFAYDLPDTLSEGPLTIKVINDGPEPHEMNILQLADGKTAKDVIDFLGGAGGPPPFVPVGGMNGLESGLNGYAEINLKPGKYVAICNIPSPKAEGHPHFALGMIKEFMVGNVASSNFPTGKFIKSGGKDYGMTFNDDQTFSVFQGDQTLVHGRYSVVGNVFTETYNDGGCKTNVSFTYEFDGKNLTFKYVDNPDADKDCTGRHADFNNVTYSVSR